jgi:pimeloyl-ACP methyl ester carboxylesterase
VVAHGVTDAGLCWTPVARALEADYDVIMVDARGHGQSDAPDTGYGPTELAADLHEGITGLGFHRPVILGHSMGAVTTLVLAGTYPDFPGMILLVDPRRAGCRHHRRHRRIRSSQRTPPRPGIPSA